MFFSSTFCPNSAVPCGPDADVRLAAHVAFFHVRAAGPDVAQDLAQLLQVGARLFRRADVRLRDDLHQRHAGAVHVDEAVRLAGRWVGLVQQAGRVLFQVHAGDADALRLAVDLDLQPAVHADRQVVLRDLVALHQVGVVVVLAVELGLGGDRAVERQPGHDRQLDGLAVDDRQHAGHAQADRVDVGVGGDSSVGLEQEQNILLRVRS